MPLENVRPDDLLPDGGAARGRPRPSSVGAAQAARDLAAAFRPARSGGDADRDQPASDLVAAADPLWPHEAIAVRLPARFGCGDGGGPCDHADQRHLGAVLRRLPSGEFRHLFGIGRRTHFRRHRFRRDAAGAVRMGPQAPRRQRRRRCARPSDAGACLPRSRPRRGHGLSPAYGEADAARSPMCLAVARGCDKGVAGHRRGEAAAARASALEDRGRSASQGLSQTAGAAARRAGASGRNRRWSHRRRSGTTTHSMCSPAPRSRHTR